MNAYFTYSTIYTVEYTITLEKIQGKPVIQGITIAQIATLHFSQ